jgi:phosphate transport system substrate-binding protein
MNSRNGPGVFGNLLLLTVVWLAVARAGAAEVRLVGSDLLGHELLTAVHAFAGRGKLSLTVTLDGSRPGLELLKSGRAQVGLLTLPAEEEPEPAVFASLPIAWHRVVVVASSANPLERITLPELAAVFGSGVGSSYNRWGDLGLIEDWQGSPISAAAPADGFGLTTAFFRQTVLSAHPLRSTVARYVSVADLRQRVSADRRVLALASHWPKNSPEGKVLSLAVRADDPAYPPTPENISSGDYPLRMALRVVYRHDAEATLGRLLVWLWGDDVAQILERADLVPLPPSARRLQVQMLEKNMQKKLPK